MQHGDILLVLGATLVAFGIIAILSGFTDRRFSRKGGLTVLIGLAMLGLAYLRSGTLISFEAWAMATIRIISSIFGPF